MRNGFFKLKSVSFGGFAIPNEQFYKGITNLLFGTGGLQIRPNLKRCKLELHKLRDSRSAVSKAEVDEVDAVDEFVDIKLGLAGLAFRLAHLAARHVEDADLCIALESERHLLAGRIGIEANGLIVLFNSLRSE